MRWQQRIKQARAKRDTVEKIAKYGLEGCKPIRQGAEGIVRGTLAFA